MRPLLPSLLLAVSGATIAAEPVTRPTAEVEPGRLATSARLLEDLHIRDLITRRILSQVDPRMWAGEPSTAEKRAVYDRIKEELKTLIAREVDTAAGAQELSSGLAALYPSAELDALLLQAQTPEGRRFSAAWNEMHKRCDELAARYVSSLRKQIGEIYNRNWEAERPAKTPDTPPPAAAEETAVHPAVKSPSHPHAGRLVAADFAADLTALETRADAIRGETYSELRPLLQRLQDQAQDRHDFPGQLAAFRRLARLPVAATAATTAPAKPADGSKPPTLVEVDRLYDACRLTADRRLAELSAPVRVELETALAWALREQHPGEATELWKVLHPLPQAWSPELLTDRFMATGGYDRTKALPITALPAYLELTVEPGGHDVHVGICGTEDEDITEIYLGGWWGRQSGIRSTPGGGEAVAKNEFALFDPARPLPDEAAVLADDRIGSPFHATLPTTFRIALSACGIVVTRLDGQRQTVVMETTQLFNQPTAFTFRSPTFRLTSLRVSPAATWSDETKRKHETAPAAVDF